MAALAAAAPPAADDGDSDDGGYEDDFVDPEDTDDDFQASTTAGEDPDYDPATEVADAKLPVPRRPRRAALAAAAPSASAPASSARRPCGGRAHRRRAPQLIERQRQLRHPHRRPRR